MQNTVRFLAILVLLPGVLFSGYIYGKTDPKESKIKVSIRNLFENGGSGEYRCAYKGKEASRPCKVYVKDELITDKHYVSLYGKPTVDRVLTIRWPDGDSSRYCWIDSGEMMNLIDKDTADYRQTGESESTEPDWSRGFVIDKDGSEHVRLW